MEAVPVSPRALRFEAGTHGDFIAHARNGALAFDAHGPRLGGLSLHVAGGRDVAPVASDPLRTKINYLKGPRSEWRQNVSTFGRVTYPGVRDGVDLVFHGEEGQVEYDFVVAPGTDANDIALEVGGADGLSLTPDGDLAIATTRGTLVQKRPRVVQGETVIPAGYRIVDHRIAFDIGQYDHDAPLVIDPVIGYATFLGGAGVEVGSGIAADGAETFIVGQSSGAASFTPPHTTTLQNGGVLADNDVFVGKIAADGSLAWLTYYGGDGEDGGLAIVVDPLHRPWFGGVSTSSNLALPPNTYKSTPDTSLGDGLLVGLTPDGSDVAYATLLDVGSNTTNGHDYAYEDTIAALAIDLDHGVAYVGGITTPPGFIHDPADPSLPGAYAAKLTIPTDNFTHGIRLGQTMFGGGVSQLTGVRYHADRLFLSGAICGDGFAGITATHIRDNTGDGACESFVTRLDASTLDVTYGTWIGGPGSDIARAMELGADDNVYVVGDVTNTGQPFPVTSGNATVIGTHASFVARVDTDANAMKYEVLFGNTGDQQPYGIALDATGSAVIVGETGDANMFPGQTLPDAFAGFVAKFDNSGSFTDGFYYGATASIEELTGVAWNEHGIFVIGASLGAATDLPNTHSAQPGPGGNDDVILARFDDFVAPPPMDAGAPPPVDAGSTTNPLAPDLALQPRAASTSPRGSVFFQANGGTPPYQFRLITDASNGSVTAGGAYVAGPRSGVVDRVELTDSEGETQIATVAVGPGVTLDPSSASAPQKGTVKFTAHGGSGSGYSWSASDGAVSTAGSFTAPSKDESVIVTVHDSLGNTGSATVSVGSALAVVPSQPTTFPRGTIQFAPIGGSGKYRYSVLTTQGGQIDARGLFTAGRVGNVTETVDIADDVGNHATTDVTVGPGLTIDPAAGQIGANGQLQLAASGGSGIGYAFSLDANPSGATVDVGGLFHAGTGHGVDSVKLVDSAGNEALASITVTESGQNPLAPSNRNATTSSSNDSKSDDGCSCRTTGGPSSSTPWWTALAVAAFVVRRRGKSPSARR